MKKIVLPDEVKYIINTLCQNSFESYVVGGCVRDSILGKDPSDWDIATNAKPKAIKSIFKDTFDTGIKHGTVTVRVNKKNFELTTYRTDGEYLENRKPKKVKFVSSLQDDLSRRDFTVNSIAYNDKNGFIDPFGGIRDIQEKIIKTVGNPACRFAEDALRMLRAVRFSAQLGFEIDEATVASVKNNSPLINKISGERIRDELTKTLTSSSPEKFVLLHTTNLLQHIIPEFEPCFVTDQNNPHHIYNVAAHIIKTVSCIKRDTILRWTMLLHDIGKPYCKTTDGKNIDHFYGHPEKSVYMAQKILQRLKFDNKTQNKILTLIKFHDINIAPDPKAVRKAVNKIGKDIFPSLLEVKAADKKGQNPIYLKDGLKSLLELQSIFSYVEANNHCTSIKELSVSGHDLLGLGIEGKQIGKMLQKLLNIVIDEPDLNNKKALLSIVESEK